MNIAAHVLVFVGNRFVFAGAISVKGERIDCGFIRHHAVNVAIYQFMQKRPDLRRSRAALANVPEPEFSAALNHPHYGSLALVTLLIAALFLADGFSAHVSFINFDDTLKPREIVATKFEGPDARNGKGAILFQRPLCVWPKVAKYKGGPAEKAESFACEAP